VKALKNKHARQRGDKRQCGKRKSGDKFRLSLSQLGYFAQRYCAARNRRQDVDYESFSKTENFKSFRGHANELRDKEPELIQLLKTALAEQRAIDAGKRTKSIEELKEETTKPEVLHNEDLAKLKQLEVDIEKRGEQHKLEISKLKESHEVEISKLQSGLNALKDVIPERGKSVEVEGDSNEVKEKVAELEEKLIADTTRQTELVAFGNRLAERESVLDEKERELAAQAKDLKEDLERMRSAWDIWKGRNTNTDQG
jgi:uncharacterized phage infection (PIP) family protein YhgE